MDDDERSRVEDDRSPDETDEGPGWWSARAAEDALQLPAERTQTHVGDDQWWSAAEDGDEVDAAGPGSHVEASPSELVTDAHDSSGSWSADTQDEAGGAAADNPDGSDATTSWWSEPGAGNRSGTDRPDPPDAGGGVSGGAGAAPRRDAGVEPPKATPTPPKAVPAPPKATPSHAPDDSPDAVGAGSGARAGQLGAPKVFVSYRRADTGTLAGELSERLRDDLQGDSVFRDETDLIGGQHWQDVLDAEIAASDAVVALVGPDWTAPKPDGSRRIEEQDDPIRHEVELALRSPTVPVPVLIDAEHPPHDLPAVVAPLFEHHAIRTTADELRSTVGAGYQHVLVGVWAALLQQVPNGVLVLGDGVAMAPLDRVVAEMRRRKQIEASTLSRFVSGAVLVSANVSRRSVRRQARKWPDAIIVADSETPSPLSIARLEALEAHPAIRRVAVVGIGAAALIGMSSVAAAAAHGVAAGTEFVTGSAVGSVLPSSGGVAAAWSSAAIGTKVAVASAATVAAVGGGAVAVDSIRSDAVEVEFDLGDGITVTDQAFADRVVEFALDESQPARTRDPAAALGPPDCPSQACEDEATSLGLASETCEFFLVVEFTDNDLLNGDGADLRVVEIGLVEPTDVFVPVDGEWKFVGRIGGGDSNIDLSPQFEEGEKFDRVRLCDAPGDSGGDTPGADIDAVATLH